MNEEKEENKKILQDVEYRTYEIYKELLLSISPYEAYDADEISYEKIMSEIYKNEKFDIISNAYNEIIIDILESQYIDYVFLRHILKKCTFYRIRKPYEILLENFEKLNPLVREYVIYLNKVSTNEIVEKNISQFNKIYNWNYYKKFPYINLWYSSLFRNEKFSNLSVQVTNIFSIRDKAFYSILKKNITWIKGFKEKVDLLGPWDKRAIIYASHLLSRDERSV